MFLLTPGKLQGSHWSCLVHIKRMSRIKEKHNPSHRKDPDGNSFMHKGVCWPPRPDDKSEDAPEAQNCKREDCLLFFHFSCSIHEWCQHVRKHSLTNLLSFRSQCTFVLDACARHTCSLSSDTQCCWTPHLLWTGKYTRVLQAGQTPEWSLHCSCVPCVLFQETKKKVLVFPSTFTTIRRTVCFLHTQTLLFRDFLGWGKNIIHIIFLLQRSCKTSFVFILPFLMLCLLEYT